MSDRELLFSVTRKDLVETPIRGSGPGGQHRNKTSTGIRLRHVASGAVAEATDDRSQMRNRIAAWQRLRDTPEWKAWFRVTVAEAMGRPSIASRVEEAMRPENIRTQVLQDDRWVDIDPTQLTEATDE